MKLWLLALLSFAFPALAGDDRFIPFEKIPPEVRPFIERGMRPLALESADLNGDGLQDVVLVLERQPAKPSDAEIEEQQRPLLILLRQPGRALRLAKRNDKVIYCSTCGGVMGDPFMGIEVRAGMFAISHGGGSGWRWSNEYTFKYSRRDATWQLVRVREENFHAGQPDKVEKKVYTPPRHFGKIGIEEFDPEKWKGQGAR
jgi:hypothetical protein